MSVSSPLVNVVTCGNGLVVHKVQSVVARIARMLLTHICRVSRIGAARNIAIAFTTAFITMTAAAKAMDTADVAGRAGFLIGAARSAACPR